MSRRERPTWALHPHVLVTPKLLQRTDAPYTASRPIRGDRPFGQAYQPAHTRLATMSKSLELEVPASCRPESDGDELFAYGLISEAVKRYTLGLQQKPSISQWAKRCAAYAHLGNYELALQDAESILRRDNAPVNRLRRKSILDLIDLKGSCTPGYESAHLTLLSTLTPRALRGWRAASPAAYSFESDALQQHSRGAPMRHVMRQSRPSTAPLAWKTRGGGADAALQARAMYAPFAGR